MEWIPIVALVVSILLSIGVILNLNTQNRKSRDIAAELKLLDSIKVDIKDFSRVQVEIQKQISALQESMKWVERHVCKEDGHE